MAKEKYKILIVEDDLDVAEMLITYFRIQGYDVFSSNWGEEGIRTAVSAMPDLVILDIRLPDVDGYEVARRLRADRKTNAIPIIFLTEKRDRADRLQGLEIGADDFVTKPFDVQELRLRVRNAIRRSNLGTLTNPITGLPEGDVVAEQVRDNFKKKQWGMVLVSMHNLEAFRDQYGFVASDDVIRAVSLMVNSLLKEDGGEDIFIGHLSQSDLLLITSIENVGVLEAKIHTRLDQALGFFYPIKDRDVATAAKDRLHIKIAAISAQDGFYNTLEEIKAELYKRQK